MIKAMIVDDEKLSLEFAEKLIESHKDIDVIGTYTDSVTCLEEITNKAPHIVFADIHMPGVNGLELAEKIFNINSDIYIVFLTGFDTFAVDAFKVDALDYILKPITKERLQKTIDRYYRKTSNRLERTKYNEKALQLSVKDYLLFKKQTDKFETVSWRTSKAQELFLYLLHHHDTYVEKETLMELLWPDKDLENSASLLYTSIYYVRKVLDSFNPHFNLKNHLDGYVLELNQVKVDVFDWNNKIREVSIIHEGNILEYMKLVNQFKGDYLSKHDYIWLESERENMKRMWKRLTDDIVDFYVTNKMYNKAIDLLQIIIEEFPDDEDAHFRLMKLYAKLSNTSAVATQYVKLVQVLKTELGINPSYEIQNWYELNVMRNNI